MTIRKLGIVTVLLSSLTLFINRFTDVLSGFFGKLFCGERYLKPVNGIVGDASCGFNADMYIALILTAITIFGLILIFVAKKK